MYVYGQLQIVISLSGHVSQAWYGCWTIKAKALLEVEAGVLYDGFTVSRRGMAAPLIIARSLRCLKKFNNFKICIKPVSYGRNTLFTLVVYIHSVASKRAVIKRFGIKSLSGKIALSVYNVYQCIVALDIA